MYSFPDLELVCCSMSSSNYCFLTCIQISQEAGQVVWYSHLFQNFPVYGDPYMVDLIWHYRGSKWCSQFDYLKCAETCWRVTIFIKSRSLFLRSLHWQKRYFVSVLHGSNKDFKWWEPGLCTIRQIESLNMKIIKDYNFAKWAGKKIINY